jgi:dihydrofolate reductase
MKSTDMGDRHIMQPMAIIVAVDEVGGFGKDGKIPWHFKEDFEHFKQTTMGHPCIMGRKTYEDMRNYKADVPDEEIKEILPGRQSFVITRNDNFSAPGATVVGSIRQAVYQLDDNVTAFVLGGEKLFIEALSWVDTIYMTVVNGDYQCDKFFPVNYVVNNFYIAEGKSSNDLKFITYKRRARK